MDVVHSTSNAATMEFLLSHRTSINSVPVGARIFVRAKFVAGRNATTQELAVR